MNKLKEKLSVSLGVAGLVLWYLIVIIITCAPLICVLRFNMIINFILVGVMMFMPLIGTIVELVLWIWSFIVAINMPFDVFMLVYYIALLFYVITKVVPAILTLFDGRK